LFNNKNDNLESVGHGKVPHNIELKIACFESDWAILIGPKILIDAAKR
jgi:hypothetical protein